MPKSNEEPSSPSSEFSGRSPRRLSLYNVVDEDSADSPAELVLRAMRSLQLETWCRRFARACEETEAYIKNLDKTEAAIEAAGTAKTEKIIAGMDRLLQLVEAKKVKMLSEHVAEVDHMKELVVAAREKTRPELEELRRLNVRVGKAQHVTSAQALITMSGHLLDDVRRAFASRPQSRPSHTTQFRDFSEVSAIKLIEAVPLTPASSRTDTETLTLARLLAGELLPSGCQEPERSNDAVGVAPIAAAPAVVPAVSSVAKSQISPVAAAYPAAVFREMTPYAATAPPAVPELKIANGSKESVAAETAVVAEEKRSGSARVVDLLRPVDPAPSAAAVAPQDTTKDVPTAAAPKPVAQARGRASEPELLPVAAVQIASTEPDVAADDPREVVEVKDATTKVKPKASK